MKKFFEILAIAASACLPGLAPAQGYRSKPIRLVSE